MSAEKLSYMGLKNLIKNDCDIKIFDSLESTNTTAKLWAQDGGAEGDLIIALSQTGGKGRMGRNFFSPKGCGIYFSIILRPKIKADDIPLITPVAAVAVATAIEKVTKKSPKIKWVNDIFLNGKKVCGILSEGAFDPNGFAEYVILGIGMNLLQPSGGFPDDIKDIAGSVFESGEDFNANEIIAAIVNTFLNLYKDLNASHLPAEYQSRMLLVGNHINYKENGIQKSGVVMGIDQSFKLIIKNKNGDLIHLQSGEVTIGSQNAKV